MVGNKWTVLAILILSEGPKRYNQMRREIETISQRMLTVTLRGLERDGFIVRRVITDRAPPQVEYSLSPMGEAVVPLLFSLCDWSARHVAKIAENRRVFDSQRASDPCV
ncbi:winged helix-turn-helix transcriptional regulator [Ketogulonicigenium robustum]|nr:helix-turn-helix domain-containing protein [Ketogulonicigenium robustum]